jgi:hypothetical protein
MDDLQKETSTICAAGVISHSTENANRSTCTALRHAMSTWPRHTNDTVGDAPAA